MIIDGGVVTGSLTVNAPSRQLGNSEITGSLRVTGGIFGQVDFAQSSSLALTASYALNAGGASFPYTGSALISGALEIVGTSSFTGRLLLSSSQAAFFTSQIIQQSSSLFSRIYAFDIRPTLINSTASQSRTALRVNPLFSGSFSGSNTTNVIVDFGTQTSGSMFLIDDVISGSVYTVNDFFGLPVLEVTSDAQVNMYDYPYAVFNKSSSFLNLGIPSSFAVDSAINVRADMVIDEGLGFSTRIAQGNATTLNDSSASLYTYTFTTNTGSAFVSAIVTGYDSASRATISGEIKSTVKCLSGTCTIVGTNFRYLNAENPGVNIDLTVSSNTFSVRAYGTGSRTYIWAATVTTQAI